MLQTLSIKNIALISSLTIDFGKGFNVLLGETGTGKSIIFDALNFVLGAKLDKTLLRYGESVMRVDAVFTGLKESALNLLKEFGIEEDEVALSRTYSTEEKSTIRINGIPSSQSVLKEVGEILVNSYSQHESIDLLKTKNHLIMLDRYGGEKISTIKENLLIEYNNLKEIEKKIKGLGGDEFERERTKSLLLYQIKEIESANLKVGEDEEIKERLTFLNNSEKIFQAISICEQILSDDSSSSINNLQQASGLLSGISGFENIDDCKNRLDSARFELEDICQTLSDIKADAEFDEDEYEQLDKRYDLIKSLTRKYGGSIENVLEYLHNSQSQYEELENSEVLLSRLENERKQVEDKLNNQAEVLSDLRKEVAKEISQKIVTELRQLGMKSSTFDVKFSKLNTITPEGFDDVEFVFSANKGQELKSLSKTASGGELSRFMLAVKNIFAEIGSAQTLVFDEIDAGISGETGNIVGQKLYNITRFAQVICITHLPQVASYGDEFYYVSKQEENNTTVTNIKHLEGDEIVYNIARMIGGNKVSEIALSHAKEMRKMTEKV